MPLKWSPPLLSVTPIFYIFVVYYINRHHKFPKNTSCKYFLCTYSYPDVMMPAYNRSRWSVIYFAVYISVTLYFLMNLVRKNSISFLSLTVWETKVIFFCGNTWGFLFIFTWLCGLQSWKLHACTCNSIFFSTRRALFMQNTM